MRKVRAVVFLFAGTVLGLVFLDEFVFHVTSGDATRYVFMALCAAASIACFRAALADWRPVRRADNGDRRLRDVRKPRVVVFCVVGTLLGLLAAFEVDGLIYFHDRPWGGGAPWPVYALMFVFPVVFGLAAVACFRLALSNWRSPRSHLSKGSGLTSGR